MNFSILIQIIISTCSVNSCLRQNIQYFPFVKLTPLLIGRQFTNGPMQQSNCNEITANVTQFMYLQFIRKLTMSSTFSLKRDSFFRNVTTRIKRSALSLSSVFVNIPVIFFFLILSSTRVSSAMFNSK